MYADAVTLEWFAKVLHKTEDAKELSEYAKSVKDNYNARLLVKDDEGKFCYRSYEKKDDGIVTTQAIEALTIKERLSINYCKKGWERFLYSQPLYMHTQGICILRQLF